MSVLMVVITAYVVGVPMTSVGVGVVIPPLLFYFIYVEDRRSVSPEDWSNQPRRTAVVTEHSRWLLKTEVLALATYEAVLLYCVFVPPVKSAWLLLLGQFPFVILALYDRIKRFPSGDSIAVGATWAYIGVFAVVVSTGVAVSSSVVLAFLGWFLIVFAGVESRNIDDITGDAEAEKTTLAGLLGPRLTRALETTVKLLGVLLFWTLAGALAAGMVILYLVGLRSFRLLTRRADALFPARGRPMSVDRPDRAPDEPLEQRPADD
jgi:1,4-dihydroxy-2-naphthoate octaprenyltransferase